MIIYSLGLERVHSTVQNRVHKAELQPESGCYPGRVAVGETVIQLGDERYLLDAAVDSETNNLLDKATEVTRKTVSLPVRPRIARET